MPEPGLVLLLVGIMAVWLMMGGRGE